MKKRLICSVVMACFMGAMHASADGGIKAIKINESPKILSSTTSGQATSTSGGEPTETVVLTIETTVGKKYQIQGLLHLAHDVWTSLGDAVIADSETTTITLGRKDAFTFFRVISMMSNETLSQPAAPSAAPPTVPAGPPIF